MYVHIYIYIIGPSEGRQQLAAVGILSQRVQDLSLRAMCIMYDDIYIYIYICMYMYREIEYT